MPNFPKTLLSTLVACCILTACQSLPKPHSTFTTDLTQDQNAPLKFSVTGKIGVTTVKDGSTQAGSAFYAWGQEEERFAIDLTGALGIGATSIRYNGTTATLNSEKTGEIRADNPEDLLKQATGWQAPVSHLPYWIAGRHATGDKNSEYDPQNRLTRTENGDWTAHFEYNTNATPSRLRITHSDGHRVVMTIVAQ
ncbi:MAG: lipoprotein insertase outer membrane protein LolB [Moraxella sp.]|nr:lipoprotein insertase outer membrane protein LolB [Moraxella sp.]